MTVLALVLRLHNIEGQSLWLDEAYTLLFSGLPLSRLFVVGGVHEHPPLYYLLVHVLRGVVHSAFVPRVLSAIAGTVSVPVLFALGSRLFNRAAGLVAATLLALSPFHIWYSQDGRAYELAGLLVLLSYLLLFTVLQRPCSLLWWAYSACLALSLYTEYTTILVLLPQGLMFLSARESGLRRFLLRSWLVAFLAFLPWVGTVVLDASSIAGNYWIPPPSGDSVTSTTLEFLGLSTPCPSPPCVGSEATLPLLSGHEQTVAAIAIILSTGVLAVAVRYRKRNIVVLSLWLLLPFVVILAIALRRSLYLDRVFLDATFPLYLLMGAAIVSLARGYGRTALAATLVVILCIVNGLNVNGVYAFPTTPDWQSASRDLAAAYRPGQAVVFNPGVLRTLVSAYLPPGWHATRERSLWYYSYLDVPAWKERYSRLTSTYLKKSNVPLRVRIERLDTQLRERQLAAVAAHNRQVWLVAQDYSGLADTRNWFVLHGYYLILSQLYDRDSRLELWSRGEPRELGPATLRGDTFHSGWRLKGAAVPRDGRLVETGRAGAAHDFPVTPGSTYIANIEYRAMPPTSPLASIQTYDRNGHPVGSIVSPSGGVFDTFPRTEWYNMPANGLWLSEPFGFIAPPGAVRATLRLQTTWGHCAWRNIAVYRER